MQRTWSADGLSEHWSLLRESLAPLASRIDADKLGLEDGSSGAKGRQWLEWASSDRASLSGSDQAGLVAVEVFTIQPPGGGGYGAVLEGGRSGPRDGQLS